MCETSTKRPSDPISYAEGSPVRTSAKRDQRSESTGSDRGFGESSLASFASYDRGSSSWKMSQTSFAEVSDGSSVTWPRAGTMRSGTVYQRKPLAPRIVETGFSLWPTPTKSDVKRLSEFSLRSLRKIGREQPTKANFPERWTTACGYFPSPEVYEWVMGFPSHWTALPPSGTP